MATETFGYHVVYKQGTDREPTSLIASWVAAKSPLQAVIWSRPDQSWIYASAIAARRLYDDQYQDTVEPVDRSTAERIAQGSLGTRLPSGEELHRICQEGERLGQEWGPKRS